MKLVRDNIPDIIEESGKSCSWRWVKNHEEHLKFLKLKILEETSEFIENPCVEEAADILEVLRSLIDLSGLSFDKVMIEARLKSEQRGGFKAGVILEKIINEKG